mmetsp:Transcript_9241/g.12705  ORF Transcript_9241/g.12705 Transcript_9241/m.12705 type:complete len:230 (-) Transcript_9241:157-846(-)
MTTYIEAYLHSLRDLPNDIHRAYALIGVTDEKVSQLKVELQNKYEEVYKMAAEDKASPSDFAKKLSSIRQDQKFLHSLNEDKIQLVEQAAYYVNSFMTRLDRDLRKYEDELGAQQRAEALQEAQAAAAATARGNTSRTNRKGESHRKRQRVEDSFDSPPNKCTKVNGTSKGGVSSSTTEELYCYCQRPSYGDMVGCDGENCQYEWFHFECVGLTQQPKGNWFCQDCRNY